MSGLAWLHFFILRVVMLGLILLQVFYASLTNIPSAFVLICSIAPIYQ
jgi:hypothetical protein